MTLITFTTKPYPVGKDSTAITIPINLVTSKGITHGQNYDFAIRIPKHLEKREPPKNTTKEATQ